MTIKLFYRNAFENAVGPRHGLKKKEIDGLKALAGSAQKDLQRLHKNGTLGFYDLPEAVEGLKASRKVARYVRGKFDNFVLLGIGGSALGPICVHTALAHPYYNLLDDQKRGGPRMFFLDNADPEWVGRLVEAVDLKRTFFSVVSKSGSTPETLAQMMVFYEALAKAVGASNAKNHFCVTTDPAKGPLRELAVQRGWMSLEVPPNVGGRFSVLSAVGLLPAEVEGISGAKLLKGAAEMAARCESGAIWKNPAMLYAAIHYLTDTTRGKSISVMMPYANALRDVADWNRQLWAESLGKAFNTAGKAVNVGQTPVKALGATDQHSQVQLYAEGPNNKIFTFIGVDKFRTACPIPKSLPELKPVSYLSGNTMERLLNEELNATEFALAKSERPSIRLQLDKVTAENIGGLFFLLEAATAFAGGLYGIDAFDQPGVEEGKKATAALMGRGLPEDVRKSAEIARMKKGADSWL